MTAVVIFDFDGTILDTERPAYEAARELWAEHGIELTLEQWSWRLGTAGHDNPFVELQERLGRPLDPALNERRLARKEELTDLGSLRPGVLAWLDDAARLGVPVGIASSSPRTWLDRNLARLGLLDRFGCFACRPELPPKPDPTSYRHAVEQLGGDPAVSVAVEDSPHGITAALAAGLFTVAVPHDLTRDLDLSGAHRVVESLEDLPLGEALEAAAQDRRATS